MFDKKNVTTTATIYNLKFLITRNLWHPQRGYTFLSLSNASSVDVQNLDTTDIRNIGIFVFYGCVTNDHKLRSVKWYSFIISQPNWVPCSRSQYTEVKVSTRAVRTLRAWGSLLNSLPWGTPTLAAVGLRPCCLSAVSWRSVSALGGPCSSCYAAFSWALSQHDSWFQRQQRISLTSGKALGSLLNGLLN